MPSLAGLVIKVLQERKFPKRQEAQINFLADSLAALGRVRPRRSRDICGEERAEAAPSHNFLRILGRMLLRLQRPISESWLS